jgi:hypothetical protein
MYIERHVRLQFSGQDSYDLMHSLSLHGQMSHNIPRVNNEHIESW